MDARYGPGVRVLAGSYPPARRILWIVGLRGGTWRYRVKQIAVLLTLLILTQRFRRQSMAAVAKRAMMAANSKNPDFSGPDACPVPVKSDLAGGPRRSPEFYLNRRCKRCWGRGKRENQVKAKEATLLSGCRTLAWWGLSWVLRG